MLLSNEDKKILAEAQEEIRQDLVLVGGSIEGWHEALKRRGFSASLKDFKNWLKRNRIFRNDRFDRKNLENPRKVNEDLAIFDDLTVKIEKAFAEGATFNEALAYAQKCGFMGKRTAFTTFIEEKGIYKRKDYRDVQSGLAARDAKIQKMLDAGKSVKEIRRELEDKHGFHCTRDSLTRYLANRHKAVTISGFFTVMKDRIKNRIKTVWRKWRAAWMKRGLKRQKSF